jgi:hypothetical protein
MTLKSLFCGIALAGVLVGCDESVAPDPEGPRFAYDVSGYGETTTYSGASAGFTIVSDPCTAGASLLRIDLTSSDGMRTTFALRLGEPGAPIAGVYPFSIARLPGVADVIYSDVPQILAWRGHLAFLRLTGELRLVELGDSRIAGSFDLEAISSHFGPEPVGVKGTFDAAEDPNPVPVALECESSAPPTWSHRIEPAIIAATAGLENPRVEVGLLNGSAVVGIKTAGTVNCHARAETEVVVEGRTATITARNYVVLAGTACPRAVGYRVATAVVPFGSGPAVIHVVGLDGTPQADTVVVERSVTIP